MIEASGRSTEKVAGCLRHRVPAPPGVVMVSPPTTQRNASEAGAQSEGRARSGVKKSAAKCII
jgi:hypothetical protein